MSYIFLSLCLITFLIPVFSNAVIETNPSETVPRTHEAGLFSTFLRTFPSVIVAELGDNTFFVAAIMAMKYNRNGLLLGSILALFFMAAISTAFGSIVPKFIPRSLAHIIVTIIFFLFGLKLLYTAYKAYRFENKEENTEQQEEFDIELNLIHRRRARDLNSRLDSSYETEQDPYIKIPERPAPKKRRPRPDLETTADMEESSWISHLEPITFKPAFWEALTMTFLGEWGDRSQVSIITLAADNDPYYVFIGAFAGYIICVIAAVFGGKIIAKKISENMFTIGGGILFLLFGIHNVFFVPV